MLTDADYSIIHNALFGTVTFCCRNCRKITDCQDNSADGIFDADILEQCQPTVGCKACARLNEVKKQVLELYGHDDRYYVVNKDVWKKCS